MFYRGTIGGFVYFPKNYFLFLTFPWKSKGIDWEHQAMGKYFHWHSIWKVYVPPRVSFFYWCAVLGKVLTTDNLRKQGIIITYWCFLCKNHGESMAHFFLHCAVARELWSLVFCLFGVSWVMPNFMMGLLSYGKDNLTREVVGIHGKLFHCA